MALYTTATAANADAYYQAIRTQMLVNGWTAHDILNDIAGTRDIVFRSSPLDAIADNRAFVRLSQDVPTFGTNHAAHGIRVYRDWDPVAHVGIQEGGGMNTGAYVPAQSSTFTYFMRVTPHSVATVAKLSGPVYWLNTWGFLRRGLNRYKGGVTKTTQAYASGVTEMNVASDMTDKIRNGQRVLICNYAHSNPSANKNNGQIRIVSAVTPTKILFTAATTQAFDSGALIGWNPLPTFVGQPSTIGTTGYSPLQGIFFPMNLDGTVGSGSTSMGSSMEMPIVELQYADPGNLDQEYGPMTYDVFQSAVPGKEAHRGHLYSLLWTHSTNGTGTAPAIESIMDCGPESYIVLGRAQYTLMMGPR